MNRLKRLLTLLLLAVGFTTGSWALTQDTDGYYLIGSAQDWNDFATHVETTPTANARMTADIDLGDDQTMIGTSSAKYQGTLDGQGHTLTINYTTTENYYAPFRYIQGAKIKNLHVAGTIHTSHRFTGGLVGESYGTSNIENCRSSVELISSYSGDAVHSGFVASIGGGTLNIKDCLFDGILTGSSALTWGGFVGWKYSNTANINNCLFNPKSVNVGAQYSATFSGNGGTVKNCYYTVCLNNSSQGTQVTAAQLSDGAIAFQLQHARTDLVWGQAIGTDNIPVMTAIESKRVYRAEGGGYTNDPLLAAADQSIPPFTYTESNGNITITGFELDFTPPANYALVIPDEIEGKPVVAIGNQAFFEKTNFISLYVGKNVKTIGNDAFRRATAMKSVTFAADGVIETLGESAFRGCAELTEFTMPNTVKTVGAMVLQANAKLASVTLSNQLTTLASQALCNTPLLASIEIPSSVKSIEAKAFWQCTGLTSITIPSSVTSMGTGVFQECTSLASITFEATCHLTSIPNNTFTGCTLLNGVTIPSSVTSIGTSAFENCTGLTAIEFPSSVKTINNSAFKNTGLTSVTLPATVTSMGDDCFRESAVQTALIACPTLGTRAFYNCTSLGIATIANTVTSIGTSAFENCTGLTAIEFPSSVKTINNSAFKNTGLTSVTLPATVTSMGDDCFRESAVQTVSIACPTLGTRAFYGCTSLGTATIANTVTNLKESSFYNCTQLANISIPSSVTTIGNSVFNGCTSFTAMTIPSSVTTMGTGVFQGCTNLASATYAEGFHMTQLPESTFYGCTSLNGINIPASITTIGNNAFRGCTSLTDITIPANVTTMGTYVFYGCNLLTTATFVDGCQLTQIPQYTFWGCTQLSSVNIHSTVTSIGDYAFSGCSNLTAIIVPANVTSIGSYAFNQCTALNNVTIPVSVKTINSRAFYQCTNLANLTIEEGLTTLAADVFQYSGLTSVTLPSTVTSIGNNLFYRCDNLATLDLSKADKVGSLYALTTINRSATGIFNGIPADCEVILPYGCRATGDHVSIAEPDENSIVIANDGYYELSTAEHWKVFSAITQTVPKANARMTADIDLGDCQAMLGDSEHEDNPTYSYQGTFDGQGHTLTVHYTGTSQTAPFAMLKAATIKNVHVDGTIRNTSGSQPAVIARVISGTTTVENVWSSVITTDTRTGWDEAAAFVGCVDGYKNGHVVMRDCIFTGTVNSSGNYNGCFVGFINSGGSATVSNCLSLGTFNYTGDSYEIARGTYSNCFVKQWPTTIPAAMQVTNDQIADGTIAYKLQNNRTELFWGQRIGIDERPVLTNDESYRVYRSKNGGYTNDSDLKYDGLKQDGEDYYLLSSLFDWQDFALLVETEPTANARMTADIDLGDDQTTIGTMDNPFQGTFDGQGHKLTINFTPAEERFGLFRFVSGVTIKNLHLTGSINTAYRMVGSFIGRIDGGTCNITNSRSSVYIHSNTDSGHQTGGFVGRVSESFTLNISDCLFDGSIEGKTASNYCGGIVGYNVGTLTMCNCLFMPGTAQIGNSSTSTLAQSAGTLSISNCYYTTAMGTVQGVEATATDITDGTTATALQAGRDETVWVQDPLTNQPMLALFAGKYTVPASGLGTFSAKANFTLPEGLEAYYCENYHASEGAISVVPIEGVVPANTGILLRGTAGETYTLTISNETPAKVEDNALVAVTDQTTIQQINGDYTNFGLSGGEFKMVNSAGGTVKANRAYLHILTSDLSQSPFEARGIAIDWDDESTAIGKEVIVKGAESTSGQWYTIGGCKLAGQPTQKGIYIVNGKKVVIK